MLTGIAALGGAASLALLMAMPAAAQSAVSLDERAAAQAAAVQADVVKWRRDIHQHPELSEEEVRTAKLVADHLRALGLEVRTGIAKTGVVGILRGGKPGGVVALRADMDALPVEEQTGLPFASKVKAMYDGKQTSVMHACGHDAHVAMLMGTAKILAGMKADIAGTVIFVFQPSEEGTLGPRVSGAELMIKENLFGALEPDAIFAIHVVPGESGKLLWRSGGMYAASDRIEIRLSGKQTHGARPWDGTDMPAIASGIVQDFAHIASRQVNVTHAPTVLTIAAINGGNRFNIIPESMTLLGTLRTFDPEMRKLAMAKAEASVASISALYGGSAEFIWTAPTPAVINDPKLTAAMTDALRKAAGKAGIDNQIDPATGSDDYSYFSRLYPSIYYNLGIGFPKGTNHSPFFDVVDEGALEVGVRSQVLTTLTFLQKIQSGELPRRKAK
ncbi:N-acyl-L-amino acid amidohydrolase [Sphingomonas sp. SRS2]|nr:N-acyl-L-amino acid amidohydrolase [Sphingomonas sp. SRS2]